MDIQIASTQRYQNTSTSDYLRKLESRGIQGKEKIEVSVITIPAVRKLIAATIISQTIAPLFQNVEVASAGTYEAYSTELDSFTKSAAWAPKFFYESAHLKTVKELVPYYKGINELLFEGKYKECDLFLSYIKVENLSDVLLIGLLRLTYSKRNELSTWSDLLAKSVKDIEKRGLKGKIMLKGLI